MKEYSQLIVGKQIKKYRTAKKLSQKKLGELVGVSGGYIGELERGGATRNGSVSMENICKIATILNVSLDELAGANIEYEENPTTNKTNNTIARELNSLSIKDLLLYDKLISIISKRYKKS